MSQDISSLLTDAAVLLLVGMSVVFFFLSLLIIAIQGIAWFCRRFSDTAEAPREMVKAQQNPSPQAPIDPAVIAAVTAAVHQYRSRQP